MNNSYEARLGTDWMLPLVFRMALPAVMAQLVNLLYNLVDRIYIGHIPDIGTDALAGIGVTGSVIILISSFSAIVGGGGAPLAAIALGQDNRRRAGEILGNGFPHAGLLHPSDLTDRLYVHGADPVCHRCLRAYHRICHRLPLHLPGRYPVRRVVRRTEPLHQHPGPTSHCHVFGTHRCHTEHPARPAVHLHFRHGSKRRRTGNHPVTSLQCHLGAPLSHLTTCLTAPGTQIHETP